LELAAAPAIQRLRDEAVALAAELEEIGGQLKKRLAQLEDLRGRADPTFVSLQAVDLSTAAASSVQKAETLVADLVPALDRLQRDVTATEKARAQLTTLIDISQTINSTLDLDQLLNMVMDEMVGVMKAERGFLMLIDEQTGELEFKVARNMDRETIQESSFQVSRGIIDRVVKDGNPIVTTNAQDDDRWKGQASVISYGLRSILSAPLVVKDRMIGVVYIDNRIRAGLFSEKDLNLLVAFCNQAAIAIENARLFESIVQKMNEISEMKVQMDNIFASIASGVVTMSCEGVVTAFNASAENIFGVSGKEAVGQHYTDVFYALRETPLLHLIERVMDAGRRYIGYEIECSIGDRRDVVLSLSLSALKNASNEMIGAALVVEDLTETRRLLAAEKKIKDTFQRYVAKSVVDRLLSAPPKLGGERQTVTVLFADIRGYTSLSERMSPEELVSILNHYLGLIVRVILRYEGTVDKFMGDGIMAIYNAPLSQPDHALRAVKTALDMQTELEQYHQQAGIAVPKVTYGIGINTGEAVVGNLGTADLMNYTVIGDAVNTSRRLQESAQGGQILLSGSTYEQVRKFVTVEELEPVQLKGKSGPVPVFNLVGMRSTWA